MKNNTIKINSILYTIKTLVTMIVPMLTFPYASRLLGVEEIGKVSFVNSIVNYFVLIAGLGIQTHAIRVCSKYREDKEKLEKYANEIFTINVISTLFSYGCFVIFIIINAKMDSYLDILFVLSLLIIVNPFGIEWIYIVFEDFVYITVRTIIIQVASLLFLFFFMDSKEDVLLYAFFTTIPTVGANLLNFIKSKKYFSLKLVWNKEITAHIKPILVLFASSIASIIYLNSDMTMLGIFGTDTTVGYYAAATKIYTVLRNLFFVIITVSLPRFNYYLNNKRKEDYISLYDEVFKVMIYLLIPVSVGTLFISEELIYLLCGEAFINANVPLKILAIALIPTTIGSFWANIILVPFNKEKCILFATAFGAVFNILINFWVLPQYYEIGAAITTLFSEIIVLFVHAINIKKMKLLNFSFVYFIKALVGTLPFCLIVDIIRRSHDNFLVMLFLEVCVCALFYGIIISVLNVRRIIIKNRK